MRVTQPCIKFKLQCTVNMKCSALPYLSSHPLNQNGITNKTDGTGLDRIGRTGNIRHVVLLVLLGVRVEGSGGRRLVNAWNRWCYPVMTMGNIILASDVRCYSKKSGNWNLSWQALKLQNTSTTCLKATCGLFSASHGDCFGCIMDGWIPALHTDADTSLLCASDLLDRLCCGWASLWHFQLRIAPPADLLI